MTNTSDSIIERRQHFAWALPVATSLQRVSFLQIGRSSANWRHKDRTLAGGSAELGPLWIRNAVIVYGVRRRPVKSVAIYSALVLRRSGPVHREPSFQAPRPRRFARIGSGAALAPSASLLF